MIILDRIIAYLKAHLEGVDDDELASRLQLKRRQQANARCRQLAGQGLVERRRVNGKIHSFWVGGRRNLPPSVEVNVERQMTEPWFWEGNVQAAIVKYLAVQEWAIRSVVDTATRQRGKDIVAERKGNLLWISVKGYPKGTKKTHPSTQAGHWFKQAVFDLIEYRGESKTVELGMALPDFPRYRSLAKKINWFQPLARFNYYWVREIGEVSVS